MIVVLFIICMNIAAILVGCIQGLRVYQLLGYQPLILVGSSYL